MPRRRVTDRTPSASSFRTLGRRRRERSFAKRLFFFFRLFRDDHSKWSRTCPRRHRFRLVQQSQNQGNGREHDCIVTCEREKEKKNRNREHRLAKRLRERLQKKTDAETEEALYFWNTESSLDEIGVSLDDSRRRSTDREYAASKSQKLQQTIKSQHIGATTNFQFGGRDAFHGFCGARLIQGLHFLLVSKIHLLNGQKQKS